MICPTLFFIEIVLTIQVPFVFSDYFDSVYLYLRNPVGIFFFLTLYFVLEYSCLTVLWQFQVDSRGPSHTDTCIHSPPDSLPIQAATQRGSEFHVLYSRSLTALHFKHSCWDFYWNCVKSVEQLGNCSCLSMLILLIYDHDFI